MDDSLAGSPSAELSGQPAFAASPLEHALAGGNVTGIAIELWQCDPDDPVRLSTPFFNAAAAAAFDVPVEVYFTARSVLLLKPGVAASLYSGDQRCKSVYDYMRDAVSHGARFYACTDALAVHGLNGVELIPECSGPGGAVRFMSRALEPGWRCLVF